MSKDSKYFHNTKKGEIPELQADLNSLKEDKKKEAVKKVIALMTVGKDVSMLFTDVLKCITTSNLELKKLVYLYIMNYAASNAENAILAVNTFHQDCNDPNPLVRALAIRTMGCLRVDKIVEYLCEPLRNCLQDQDPYVAKTAAVCVAKLYDINPTLVETQGFLTQLRDLLASNNPTVVSNAVAALCEIDEVSPESVFTVTRSDLGKLLTALEESTEWGQVFILTSLAKYIPKEDEEAQKIADKVTPRLQHANSAVVLAAIKVLMKLLDRLEREKQKEITKKMRPPLVTMLSKESEIQYVALRNINLILQKRPNILNNEIKVFFCHYNDPLYVKMEKLEIMIMLASEKNIDQVLVELKEYCNRADVEFVRKAVRAIGRSAIKLEKAAEKCVQVLLELIKSTRLSYVIQESVVVIKDIFRRYAQQYEHIIGTLLADSLVEQLDEPDAKASIIWIIGEYADKIPNAKELIKSFLGTFKDESPQVQLQLLTAVVKLFLKEPETTQQMAQDTLHLAMTEIDNPDTRDRAFLYWRLLTIHPSAAKSVVCSQKPLLSDDSEHLDTPVLDELISNISTIASVYHKPPSTFVKMMRQKGNLLEEEEKREIEPESLLPSTGDLLGGNLLGDTPEVLPVLLAPQPGVGLQINGKFATKGETVELRLQFTNHSSAVASEFLIKFKQNIFNIDPAQNAIPIQPLTPGNTLSYNLPCVFNKTAPTTTPPSSQIQVALKTSLGVVFFAADLTMNLLLSADGRQDKSVWLNSWRTIEKENYYDITNMLASSLQDIQNKLEVNRVFYVAHRNINGQDFLYMSAKSIDGNVFLIEISQIGGASCRLCVKTQIESLAPLLAHSLQSILTSK